jgi:hypothetical protein
MGENKQSLNEQGMEKYFFRASAEDFKKIPGSPIAYWASPQTTRSFLENALIGTIAETRKGMGTGNNARFVRYWHEVSKDRLFIGCSSRVDAQKSQKRWFPYNDGGAFRKWYGNNETVVNWENDGEAAKAHATIKNGGAHWSRYLVSLDYFFRSGITWTAISSAKFSARLFGSGYLFSSAGMCLFSNEENYIAHLGFLNSSVSSHLLKFLSPTLNYGAGEIGHLPIRTDVDQATVTSLIEQAVSIAKKDWDSEETSWDFTQFPIVVVTGGNFSIAEAWKKHATNSSANIAILSTLETENNRIFINAYGLQDELSPEVPESQITLTRADREKDCQRLISYAIGCMMGRYSLDEPGLIYAHAGNVGFDPNRYTKFPADADGIVPITDELWFEDDAAWRIREFLSAVWGGNSVDSGQCEVGSEGNSVESGQCEVQSEGNSVDSGQWEVGSEGNSVESGQWEVGSEGNSVESGQCEVQSEGNSVDSGGNTVESEEKRTQQHFPLPTSHSSLSTKQHSSLPTNLQWLAESLGTKLGETPDETIRRYIADKFFKDHLQTYKRRPIYWLFSSGKQGAFQALVYLHRYHEGTLARMRGQYVVPLIGKIQSRIDMLKKDAAAASSTAARNKLAKQIESLKKKHTELIAYDEQLRHYADMRIQLDLDDGVKVNYGKFGNLLAEVKAVTGGVSDD